MSTPEIQMKIALWRQKTKDKTITLDEMKEAILLLRQGRVSVMGPKAKAKKPSKSADDLLNELDAM